MKIKQISGILIALLLPIVVAGQPETYSIDIARFNSKKYDEFSPVYYRDGLVFCSNQNRNLIKNYRTSENKGLLKINFVDFLTGRVTLFSKNLATRFNDGPASFSRNGDTIYFSRNLKVDGPPERELSPRNKLGIFIATFESDDWGKILDVRFNNEYYNITTPYISSNSKRLFFSSDNPSGIGGTDLYYCNWKGDYWDEPINMGPEINTSGNESFPFVDMEGGLYFSSDGLPGMGGKDIFYTKESKGKWLVPVHLDPPVNSKFDDFAFIADSVMSSGYFSSKRGRSIDIYHFKTNIRQLFYCDKQRSNQYCFKFTDESDITIDQRYLQLVWNFGDGTTATGLNAEHCYKGPGSYKVKLEAVDKKTGRVVFTKLSYDLELKNIEQPVITSPASAMTGEPVSFNGMLSNFPESEILNYTWYFGDGEREEGKTPNHVYSIKGDYDVKLGLVVRNSRTGYIQQACVVQPIRIFNDKLEKSSFDKREIKPLPLTDVFDYDHAFAENIFSAERSNNPDLVYRVEIVNSKTRLEPGNEIFKKVPVEFKIKEEYLPGEKKYSYFIAEELSLMAAYPAYNEIANLGYGAARVLTYTLVDPAERELNNLKRVFGVSTDIFFGMNNYSLTSAGTQLLDLVLGFMSKYPDLKLEIGCHSDNQGMEWSKQNLSVKRAEAMVNYLVANGISRLRLVPKGYGDSRPVAPNYQESDRKLNRRIDFRITENKSSL